MAIVRMIRKKIIKIAVLCCVRQSYTMMRTHVSSAQIEC